MKDRLAGKYNSIYGTEFKMAKKFLQHLKGKLEWSNNDYEAFTFKANDLNLIFYPHKTSAGNYHIRVRGTGKNIEGVLKLLYKKSGFNCTFSRKFTLTKYKK